MRTALFAAMVMLGIGFASTAQAQEFTVTSTADSNDPGTLRTAINDATASGDLDDRIVFQAGLSGTINLTSNLPQATGPLEIRGPGSDKLAIDGGDANSIFVVIGGGATISGLTLKNASSPAGGAVALAEGTSVIDGVRIESNEGMAGGGVLVQNGSLTIKDSQLIDNKSQNAGGGFIADSSELVITGTTVSGNEAEIGAGGSITGGEANSVRITNSNFSNNSAKQAGGGLAVFTPSVEDFVSMKTEIAGSTFTGNKATAELEAGGLGGGAIFSASSDTDVDSSLFENNSSASAGGALYLSAPLPANRASVQNSTFVGNTAKLAGAGIAGFTLGLKIDSSTLTGNQTTNPFNSQFSGGGLSTSLQTEVKNSIITGNLPADVSSAVASEQAKGEINGSFNLIGNKPDAMYTETVAGSDLPAGDPKLAPLADNGGPTRTMLPAADSPVVNKGSSFLETDQRGLLRPVKFGSIALSKAKQANGADIGAVELQSNQIRFGKVKLKKKQGIAILPVILPSSGKLTLKGTRSVKGQTKSPTKATTLKVKVQAKGKALKKLKKVGTVKVKLAFAFQPAGGVASSKNKTIRLAMKKRRGKR